MKPSRLQHILAYSVEISASTGVLGAWIFGFENAGSIPPPMFDLSYIGAIFSIVLMAIPGGAVVGLLLLFPWLRTLACQLNGAPFKVGDSVQILRGPYRGKVTRVYELWDIRNELRVVIGEEQRKAVKDVFEVQEVCRD